MKYTISDSSFQKFEAICIYGQFECQRVCLQNNEASHLASPCLDPYYLQRSLKDLQYAKEDS